MFPQVLSLFLAMHAFIFAAIVNCIQGSIRLVVGDSADDFYQGLEMDNIDVNYIDDSLSQGRVEICIEGSYGTICASSGHGWTNEDAAVVCNELGFTKFGMLCICKMFVSKNILAKYAAFCLIYSTCTGATAVGGGFFGTQSLQAVVTNFACTGNEDRLFSCPYESISGGQCIHDAAVICQGKKMNEWYIICCK